MYYYLGLALVFCFTDALAGWIAGAKWRPIGSVIMGMLWPVSIPFALLLMGVVLRRYKYLSYKYNDSGY